MSPRRLRKAPRVGRRGGPATWVALIGLLAGCEDRVDPLGAGADGSVAQDASSNADTGPQDAVVGTDAGPLDASVARDVGPACGATWSRVVVPIVDLEPMDPSPTVGQGVRIWVEANFQGCDRRGPIDRQFDTDRQVATVQMQVWRPSECGLRDRVVRRPVMLSFDQPGIWTIRSAGDTATFDIGVFAPPALACDPNRECIVDCDCPSGERCLGYHGFAGPGTRCAVPCEFDLDCGPAAICARTQDFLDMYCRPEPMYCDDDGPCPEEFLCENDQCRPNFVLSGRTRRPCDCDADCEPGLRCVEPQNDPTQPRRCEAICPTNAVGWCSGGHFCGGPDQDVASVAANAPICVWGGD